MPFRKTHPPGDRFLHRAVKIAKRDGIPEVGSSEIRLHRKLDQDPYISTDKVMVSFRTARGLPVALLERLYADDENTHITGRNAVVLDPLTGVSCDAGLFFQSEPGSYTSVLARMEIGLDKTRKQINREKRGTREKMNGHVLAQLSHRADSRRGLIQQFMQAAAVLEISASPWELTENRHLFKIHPSSQIAG